jgi:hypothetical protein
MDNVSSSLAAKTIKKTLVRINTKGRLGLLMKGARSHPPASGRPQIYIAPNQFNDINPLFNLRYDLGIYHIREP